MNHDPLIGEPPRTNVLLITSNRHLAELVRAVTGPLRVPLTVTGSVDEAQQLMHTAALVLAGADKLPALAKTPQAVRQRLLAVTAGADAGILTLAADLPGSVVVCRLPMATAWLTEQITAAISPAAPADGKRPAFRSAHRHTAISSRTPISGRVVAGRQVANPRKPSTADA